MHAVDETAMARMGVTGSTLDAIFQLRCGGRPCTVDAAEDLSVCFDTVADDAAIAVPTNRRQRVDCAFEAIEGMTLVIDTGQRFALWKFYYHFFW